MRAVGWSLRAYWGKNIFMIEAGITSEVFLIISSMVVVSFNSILAQRLFTWRQQETFLEHDVNIVFHCILGYCDDHRRCCCAIPLFFVFPCLSFMTSNVADAWIRLVHRLHCVLGICFHIDGERHFAKRPLLDRRNILVLAVK